MSDPTVAQAKIQKLERALSVYLSFVDQPQVKEEEMVALKEERDDYLVMTNSRIIMLSQKWNS